MVKVVVIIVPLLLSIAFFTLAERKVLGAIQRRRGPNVVGLYGLLQPLADGFKLFVKETVLPSNANTLLFILSPMLTFVVSLLGWAVIPFDKYASYANLNIDILYVLAVSSVGVYGIILSGWSSNSKYAFLGALRSTAQMVSYEISISFIILSVVVCVGSLKLQDIIDAQTTFWFGFTFFPLFLMFFVSALAETNRHPFDLPEAEAELVSGYNVEYSAMGFALFSLGEYSNMLFMSAMNSILFLGGWQITDLIADFIPGSFVFGIKISIFVVLYSVMRAALPRYRFDQLMDIGWKVFLPISLAILLLIMSIVYSFNILPI